MSFPAGVGGFHLAVLWGPGTVPPGVVVDSYFRPRRVLNGRIWVTGSVTYTGVTRSSIEWRVNSGQWYTGYGEVGPSEPFSFMVYGDSAPPWQPPEGAVVDDDWEEFNFHYKISRLTHPKRLVDDLGNVINELTSEPSVDSIPGSWGFFDGEVHYHPVGGPPTGVTIIWDPVFMPGESYTVDIRAISAVDSSFEIFTESFIWPYEVVDSVGHMLTLVMPQWMREGERARAIFYALGRLLGDLEITALDFATQTIVETATWGIQVWEQTLGFPVTEDVLLEERRALIIERISRRGGTRASFFEILEGILGTIDVVDDYPNFTVTITPTAPVSAFAAARAEALIDDLKPVGVLVTLVA